LASSRERRAGAPEHLIHRGVLVDGGDHGAVLRPAIDEIGGANAAGSFHVLNDDARIAGHVLAQIATEGARIEIVAAASAEADDDLDRLALVEIGDALRSHR
jgi:hypothetical protein